MRIPCLVGTAEPSFWTRDRRWMGFDSLVFETVSELDTWGVAMSPVAAKATIQVARALMQGPAAQLEGAELFRLVQQALRARHVILTVRQVELVLVAYTKMVVAHEITDVNEGL